MGGAAPGVSGGGGQQLRQTGEAGLATIAIIGTGLIGTSLGLALRQSRLKNLEVVGTDYDGAARSGAQKQGAFHRMEGRLDAAARAADIIVLATPVMAMRDLLLHLGPTLRPEAIVTDVGSSKRLVAEWAAELLPPQIRYVGGHPMAGRETPGPENAAADLFQGKPYCVVPGPDTDEQAVAAVTTMAEAVGAKPYFIGAEEHDSFVAAVSHLPFMLSVALMETASKSINWSDIAQLASSGFRDLSRLASGDPVMHRDIAITNRAHIVSWIDQFIRELYEIRNRLNTPEAPDPDAVQAVFEHAALERERWLAGRVSAPAAGANTEIPTFGETMGEMFIGRAGMQAQRKLFGHRTGDDRQRR